MKRTLLVAAVLLMATLAAKAQNYMVVDSEKIFKAIPTYAEAISSLDQLAEQYQKEIDNSYTAVEQMYNKYINEKPYITSTTERQRREDEIINREKEIAAYQQQVFGQEGDLLKRRVELIKPIQDRVFEAITNFAKSNNFELVLDLASNPSILYYAPSADKTDEIINLVK